ncbi:P protein [Drosophila ficusphila]|uniref:P protein n=1 Tax=Drosophila ficusphila TaxID=30025 RepID=UPI0007E7FEA5|nr:P protein [Drosophila ficusphila]
MLNPIPTNRKRVESPEPETTKDYVLLIIKLTVLVALWIAFTVVLVTHGSHEVTDTLVTVLPNQTVFRSVKPKIESVKIILRGAINDYLTNQLVKGSGFPSVAVRLELRHPETNITYLRSSKWNVYLLHDKRSYQEVKRVFHFSLSGWYQGKARAKHAGQKGKEGAISPDEWAFAQTFVSVESMSREPVGLHMTVDTMPMVTQLGVMYAAILIVSLYVVIIWELADRTLCTLLITSAGLAILTVLGHRPSIETIISWVNFDAMMLLLGHMIIMNLVSETGFFEYMAVVAYRISRGHAWLMIAFLGLLVAGSSVIMDNTAMALLFSPAVIRLCEVMAVNTVLVLIILLLFTNIGGSLTPVAGPPSAIIASNPVVAQAGFTFINMTMRMLPVAVICLLLVFGLLYMTMGRRIFVLDANQLGLMRKRQNGKRTPTEVQQRIDELRARQSTRCWVHPVDNYYETLANLETNHWIRNKWLLGHSFLAFGFASSCFLMHSVPWIIPGATLGWISILAAFLLLILADRRDLRPILARVKWSILLYLASMFVLTEVVAELGLIEWLGQHAVSAVRTVAEQHRTMIGILIILWLSSLLSAFIENAAVATIMVKLCIEMAYRDRVVLPLLPLIWAATLGTSYGANGGLLGSLCNEIVAEIAKEYGYKISFRKFFVIGFPIMIATLLICSVFLMITHSVLLWE